MSFDSLYIFVFIKCRFQPLVGINNGCIIKLDLDGHKLFFTCTLCHEGNNLVGSIPTSFYDLSQLTHLSLGGNKNLIGEIDPAISNLVNLEELNWFNTSITGTIPTSIGLLTNLKRLRLGYNNLTGTIPDEISNINSLISLNLEHNLLRGSIPISISLLTNLEDLRLENNDLEGTIPEEIGTLINLTYLNLEHNDLTGSIPSSIGSLINLEELNFYTNSLTGTIPASIGDLSALEALRLGKNNLSGSIPPELGNLMSLTLLWISDNELSGSIPPELGDLSNLTHLYIGDNNFTGSIPPELGNLSSVVFFQVHDNRLEGPIPPELGDLPNLRYLRLQNNSLTGPIPIEITRRTELIILHLGNNNLSGVIPSEIANLTNLLYLNLSNNNFEHLPDVSNLTLKDNNPFSTDGLWVSGNKLTFKDILPNMSLLDHTNFNYNTQQAIFNDTTILKSEGSNLIIDLEIDDTVSSNIYEWYKNGNLITTITGNNQLIINNIQNTDEGIYHCLITNPNAPDLTLTSRNITIQLLESDCYPEYLDIHNPIPSHVYIVETKAELSGIIESSSTVEFIAGNSITLKSGFHAKLGCDFLAKINSSASCNNLLESTYNFKTISTASSNLIKIYPNPSLNNSTIQVQLAQTQKINLTIYSLAGQVIEQIEQNKILNSGHHLYEFHRKDLEQGIYIISLETEKERINKKIIFID